MRKVSSSVSPALKAASTASLVSAAAIRKFLEGAKVEPASGGTSIDAAKASVTRVICVRKIIIRS